MDLAASGTSGVSGIISILVTPLSSVIGNLQSPCHLHTVFVLDMPRTRILAGRKLTIMEGSVQMLLDA